MAEVGQKLGSGVCLLSALRTGQSRPVSPAGGPGCLLVAPRSSVRGRSVRGLREDQPACERRATRHRGRKVSSSGKSESQLRSAVFLCATTSEPRFTALEDTRGGLRTAPAALQPSPACARLLRQSLSGRPTLWSKGGVSIHPDPFTAPQQPRAFCTVVFILPPKRPGGGPRRLLLLHPDVLQAPAGGRSYSWSSEETPLLHRSRTAYYDTLSVSPSATQSQIKTAYYKQSFIYHPDKNPGDKEATQRFSEISEAYSVLGNISLRRKYDRGILSQSDVQSAGRPSSRASRSTGPSPQQQQQQQRARQFSRAGGKPIFDFDAFYQAHYGEQLQRERELKARKEQQEAMQKKRKSRWMEQKMMEITLSFMLAVGGLIFINLWKP